MTTIAFPRAARRRAITWRSPLAGFAALWVALSVALSVALWAATAPAQAPDCELDRIPTGAFATADVLAMMAENIACLERRVEALREQNAALGNRLDVIEDARGAAAAAYRNRDGTVDREDRYLGPATFVVTGDRRGGAQSLRLDHALVLAMCADADGCLVTLGLTGAVAAGEPVETMFADGPCLLHLDGDTGAWSLSGLCAEPALPPAGAVTGEAGETADAATATETAETAEKAAVETVATETAAADGAPLAAAPRSGPLWGRDGSARRFSDAGAQARVVLGFAGACFLAEAGPETRRFGTAEPRLERDTEADLFLVATGAGWDPAGTFPAASLPLRVTDPDFDCRLTFRD